MKYVVQNIFLKQNLIKIPGSKHRFCRKQIEFYKANVDNKFNFIKQIVDNKYNFIKQTLITFLVQNIFAGANFDKTLIKNMFSKTPFLKQTLTFFNIIRSASKMPYSYFA